MWKAALAAIIILFLNACKENVKPVAEDRISAIIVKTQAVSERHISDQLKVSGEIIPFYEIEIFSKINGLVKHETVSLGDYVKQDQLLCEITQDVPGMDFSPVKIEATAAGFITADFTENGKRVTMQQPLYHIGELNQVYFIGNVPEDFLKYLHINDPITVAVEAYNGKIFTGKINEIYPALDRDTRSGTIKVVLNNESRKLKPGMFALAILKFNEHKGLTVPVDALIRSGSSSFVFIVKNEKAERIPVITSVIGDSWIEVSGNIKAGDRAVVLGQNLLEDGSAVKEAGD